MQLGFEESRKLLKKYGLAVAKAALCKNRLEVLDASNRLKPPFVLKAVGGEVLHKTEKNLILLNLESREDLEIAFRKLSRRANGMKFDGFLLQEQLKGVELILGASRDPVFGPVIAFGSGGVLTELYKDVSMRVAPFGKEDALAMMAETKASAFFSGEGFRGRKACSDCVADALVKLSKLMAERSEVLEVDFNPVIATEKAATIVDARVIVK